MPGDGRVIALVLLEHKASSPQPLQLLVNFQFRPRRGTALTPLIVPDHFRNFSTRRFIGY